MSDQKTPADQVDLFTLTEVPVTLTYAGLGAPPITFFLRPCLNREEQALRQTMLAQPDKDREAGQHAHNIEMLSRLSVHEPEGFVSYAGSIRKHFALEPAPEKDDATAAAQRELRNMMRRKVLNDAMARYIGITQPVEFFRGL